MKFDASMAGIMGVVFVVGAGAGVAGATITRGPERPPPKSASIERDEDRDDELDAANASLVKSLQECNRRLAAKGEQPIVAAPRASMAEPPPANSGRRGGRNRDPSSAPDWQKLAEEGAVPYRIPCIRSTPFVPSERQLDRLGLAPQDAEILTKA